MDRIDGDPTRVEPDSHTGLALPLRFRVHVAVEGGVPAPAGDFRPFSSGLWALRLVRLVYIF